MGNILNKALDKGENDEILVNMIPRCNLAYRDNHGNTLLIKACKHSKTKTALELIKRYPTNLGERNHSGNTALIWTIMNRMEEAALSLIYSGKSNPLAINNNGKTALIYSLKKNMERVTMSLIDLKEIDLKGVLIQACKREMCKLALKLIAIDPDNISCHDARGTTALIMACYHGLSEVALEIIKTGKGINWMVNESKNTALILACVKNMDTVALKLIESGDSNPSAINGDGLTALMIACVNKMTDVALALIATGEAKVGYVYHSKTALLLACNNELGKVAIEIILKGNCDIDVKTDEGVPAIKYINVATKKGYTALYLACKNNMTELANLLLDRGATWSAISSSTDTPLIWACKNGMKAIALRLLKTTCCNVFKKDSSGNTARYYTLRHGKGMRQVLKKIDKILKEQVGPKVSYRVHKIAVPTNQCCICVADIKEPYALLGCGHSEVCLTCIKHLISRGSLCPICRLKFDGYVRIY